MRVQERPTSLNLLICRSLAYPPDSDARAGRRSRTGPRVRARCRVHTVANLTHDFLNLNGIWSCQV